MRRDLVKKIQSSFLSCEKDTEEILNKLFFLSRPHSDELKKLYDEQYYKIFVLAENGIYNNGLVIKDFSQENIKEINYQPDMDLHISCDFNVDPMCWVLAHTTADKIFYFDEIILENTTTAKTCEEFCRRYPNHKGKIIINGDASGDNRSCTS